jgi:branched-chain amino acid transport system substrate-binding protein
MMFSRTMLIALNLCGLLLLVACGTAETAETELPQTDATVEATEAVSTSQPDAIRIGIVTFLSGPGAPFGVPSQRAAETIIAELNAGNAPAPYDQVGIGGVPIEAIYVDEAGSTSEQVTQFRRLIENDDVDLVIGYVSSANCQAIAPVADELQTLTVFYTCATRQLFQDASYEYVFRTKGIDLVYNVSAARYLLQQNPDIQTIAGINQDYSWGRDSWTAFSETMLQLSPDIEIVSEQFPQLFAGDYSSEISSILNTRPDALHNSFWGSDLETFTSQAAARGLFDETRGVFIIGEAMLPALGDTVPPGLIIGAEGRHGRLAPDSDLNNWFRSNYEAQHDERPIHTAYHMALTLFGVKAAYEDALSSTENSWVTQDDVIASFAGLSFDTPSGEIRMTRANGHQAVEPMAFAVSGEFDPELGEVTLTDEQVYPIECVNPPPGTDPMAWIEAGFPDADCPADASDAADAP